MDQALKDAIASIPTFAGENISDSSIQRLGGLTNRNFLIQSESGRYVIRLAGEGTEQYINRDREEKNANVASRAGVNAEIAYFDSLSGTMVTRFIENAVTLSIEKFKEPDVLRRAGCAFRQLHDSPELFDGEFELFNQIDQYLGVLDKLKAPLPDGYSAVQQSAQAVRDALARHSLPRVACHCDPMVENCIDNGERVFIIDFEYAGNNDPMWDLGDLSVEGHFTDEQDRIFLNAYFGHEPDPFDHGRMVMYKAMCDLLWTLWGVVQHANKNPADDFWAYAVGRLDRCRNLMTQPSFGDHLNAVENGPGR